MVRRTIKAVGVILVMMALAYPANAQVREGYEPEKIQEKTEDQQQAQVMQITGTVIREKTVDLKGEDIEHQVVLLQTRDGNRVIADLGPVKNLEGMALQHGKQLMLQGTVGRVSDRPVVFADQVSADGRTVQVERPELARKGETDAEPTINLSEAMEVTGEVLAEKNVEVEGMAGGNKVVLLELETGDNVVADLGPEEALGMELASGEQVEVTGNLARVGDQLVLMADQVSANGKTAEVERFVP